MTMKTENKNLPTQYEQAYMDELQWIQYRRRRLSQEMAASRQRMKEAYANLTEPEDVPSDKWERAAFWLNKGGTILRGLRIGFKVGTTINVLMKLKRMFRKKK